MYVFVFYLQRPFFICSGCFLLFVCLFVFAACPLWAIADSFVGYLATLSFLIGGVLRDIPKHGCERDYCKGSLSFGSSRNLALERKDCVTWWKQVKIWCHAHMGRGGISLPDSTIIPIVQLCRTQSELFTRSIFPLHHLALLPTKWTSSSDINLPRSPVHFLGFYVTLWKIKLKYEHNFQILSDIR